MQSEVNAGTSTEKRKNVTRLGRALVPLAVALTTSLLPVKREVSQVSARYSHDIQQPSVSLIGPVLSDQNPPIDYVAGADLGAAALYSPEPGVIPSKWYLIFGDAAFSDKLINRPVSGPNTYAVNFIVGTAKDQPLKNGVHLDGFLNMKPDQLWDGGTGKVPYRALADDTGTSLDQYTLVSGAATITGKDGQQKLIAGYSRGIVGYPGGFLHAALDSRIAAYDPSIGLFQDYKPSVNIWSASDSKATGITPQYDFGQVSFIEDPAKQFLYMVGSTTNRYGGVKDARMPVNAFLNSTDTTTPWQYYRGNNIWAPLQPGETIAKNVPWVIPPNDPQFNYSKDYSNANCRYLSIGEFSAIYDAPLKQYLLMSGFDQCLTQGIMSVYSSPAITGPWTKQAVQMPKSDWDYYAPYSSSDMVNKDGSFYLDESTYPYSPYYPTPTPDTKGVIKPYPKGGVFLYELTPRKPSA